MIAVSQKEFACSADRPRFFLSKEIPRNPDTGRALVACSLAQSYAISILLLCGAHQAFPGRRYSFGAMLGLDQLVSEARQAIASARTLEDAGVYVVALGLKCASVIPRILACTRLQSAQVH